eukprot:gene19908-22626_t
MNLVLIGYGALWAFMIASVLLYDRLISSDSDWKALRNIRILTFRNHTPQAVKSSNFRSIIPEPAGVVLSRPGTSKRAEDTPEEQQDMLQNLQRMVLSIFDRLLITAGQNKAAATTALVITQRFWYRMLSYNHYLAPYTRASQRERLVHGLNVLTRVSWLVFCVALCYWFGYEADDDSCYAHLTASECGDRVTPFNSNEEYCEWVGGTDDGGQFTHEAQCIWNFYSGNIISALHIVIVTLIATTIPRIVYTNFLTENVLLAPGGSKNVFAYNRSRPFLPSKHRFVRKVGVVDEEGQFHFPMSMPVRAGPAKKTVEKNDDPRFFNFGLASDVDTGGNTLEAVDVSQDVSVLYRSFLFDFTKYRNTLAARQDERTVEFETEWLVSNPFVCNAKGTLSELTEDIVIENNLSNRHFPDERTKVINELNQVYETSKAAAPQYKELLQNDADQFAVRLMTTFFADLLGKDSLQTRLIRQLLRSLLQDDVWFRDVRNWVKFAVVLFFLGTCCCLVYGSIEVLQHVSQRRQWYWIITVGLAFVVDFLFVESFEALWFNWAMRLCVVDSLTALKHTIEEVLQRFQQDLVLSQHSRRPLTASTVRNAPSNAANFSMPNYQFVSTNLAHRFPRHLASRIVLSYESVYPRTITAQRWPGSATVAQVLCGCERWSSGLGFESIGYVLFSYSAMWVAVLTPRWAQQILLTGLLCLAIWLLSWLIFTVERGSFIGIYIAVGVVGVCLLIGLSYMFAWDHDSEHYGNGVEGLYADDLRMDLRSPPVATPSTAQRDRQKQACFSPNLHTYEDHFPLGPSPAPSRPTSQSASRPASRSPSRQQQQRPPQSPASPIQSAASSHAYHSPSRQGSPDTHHRQQSPPQQHFEGRAVSPQRAHFAPTVEPMEYVDQRPLTAGSIFLSTNEENYPEDDDVGESKDEGEGSEGNEENNETDGTEERHEESKRDEYYLSSSSSEQGSASDASEQV